MSRHVVIVGAGIAGLSAARTLIDGGHTVELIESSDRVGGRVASDRIDGFTIDRGFQVYLSAYPEGPRFLDLRALELRAFRPGALVWNGQRTATIAHPLREPLAALTGVARGIVPLRDALRMIPFALAALRGPADKPGPSRGTSLDRLRAAGISQRTIDTFFRSFFGGVFFDTTLRTDASRLDFLLRMFADGFACVPAQGMGEIARQMGASIPSARLRLGTPAARIDGAGVVLASGERVVGDALLLATGAQDLARLVPGVADVAWCSTLSAWFATPEADTLPRWLLLNGTGRGSLNHGAAMSAIAPTYAPAGRGLFVANTTLLPSNPDLSTDVAADMRRTVGQMLGARAVDGWELLAVQRIRHAIPRQWPEDLLGVASDARGLRRRIGPRVFIAGDHTEDSSINGSMRAGRMAAESIAAAIR